MHKKHLTRIKNKLNTRNKIFQLNSKKLLDKNCYKQTTDQMEVRMKKSWMKMQPNGRMPPMSMQGSDWV